MKMIVSLLAIYRGLVTNKITAFAIVCWYDSTDKC